MNIFKRKKTVKWLVVGVMDFIFVSGIQRNVNLDAPTVREGFHSSLFSDTIQAAAAIPVSFKLLFSRIGTFIF